MILGRFWQKLKSVFTRAELSRSDPEPYRKIKETVPGLRPERSENSKHSQMVAWCRAFNQRNGHIVPERSPESIFYDSHRRRIK